MSDQTTFKTKTDKKLKKPKLYKVILLNDDYTTMDFVVEVLITIFSKSVTEATTIMLDVHKKGKGIVGVYTYDVAVTKTNQVETLAKERDFPLKTSIEEA